MPAAERKTFACPIPLEFAVTVPAPNTCAYSAGPFAAMPLLADRAFRTDSPDASLAISASATDFAIFFTWAGVMFAEFSAGPAIAAPSQNNHERERPDGNRCRDLDSCHPCSPPISSTAVELTMACTDRYALTKDPPRSGSTTR
jgi:hypothetical protein